MSNAEHTSKYWFKNASLEQYQSLKSKAATACRKGEAKDAKAIDALKADKPGSDDAWNIANTALFDVLNEMTAPDCAFQQTLSERYFEDGHGAMQFLKNWWATETNDTRATTAAEEYKVKAAQKLPTSTDAKTFATHINAMRTLQSGLKKTDRAVSEATFAMDVADLTRRMGQEYDTELRTWALEQGWSKSNEWKDPSKVMMATEMVVDKVHRRIGKTSEPTSQNVDVEGLQTLLANVRDAPCDICGVRHKDQNKPNKCHANLLAQGKPVPGWNDKPPEFKERLQKRADEIKEHGPWKDRPGRQNTGGGGGVNMRSLLML